MGIRTLFVGDLHLANHKRFGGEKIRGINRRASIILESLRLAYTFARHYECKRLCLLGDIFDTPYPEPQLVGALAALIDRHSRHVETLLLAGNHDVASLSTEDSALYPLQYMPETLVVGPGEQFTSGKVRYIGWSPRVAETMKLLGGDGILVATHMGIYDTSSTTPPHGDTKAGDVISCQELQALYKGMHLIAGHWHPCSVMADGMIVQAGAFTPKSFKDAGYGYGQVFLWDEEKIQYLDSLPGPVFLLLDEQQKIRDMLSQNQCPEWTFVRWVVPISQMQESVEATKQFEQTHAKLGGWEVLPDAEAVRQIAHEAGAAAKKSHSLGEALKRYIAGLQLPEGVDSSKVLHAVERHLIEVL